VRLLGTILRAHGYDPRTPLGLEKDEKDEKEGGGIVEMKGERVTAKSHMPGDYVVFVGGATSTGGGGGGRLRRRKAGGGDGDGKKRKLGLRKLGRVLPRNSSVSKDSSDDRYVLVDFLSGPEKVRCEDLVHSTFYHRERVRVRVVSTSEQGEEEEGGEQCCCSTDEEVDYESSEDESSEDESSEAAAAAAAAATCPTTPLEAITSKISLLDLSAIRSTTVQLLLRSDDKASSHLLLSRLYEGGLGEAFEEGMVRAGRTLTTKIIHIQEREDGQGRSRGGGGGGGDLQDGKPLEIVREIVALGQVVSMILRGGSDETQETETQTEIRGGKPPPAAEEETKMKKKNATYTDTKIYTNAVKTRSRSGSVGSTDMGALLLSEAPSLSTNRDGRVPVSGGGSGSSSERRGNLRLHQGMLLRSATITSGRSSASSRFSGGGAATVGGDGDGDGATLDDLVRSAGETTEATRSLRNLLREMAGGAHRANHHPGTETGTGTGTERRVSPRNPASDDREAEVSAITRSLVSSGLLGRNEEWVRRCLGQGGGDVSPPAGGGGEDGNDLMTLGITFGVSSRIVEMVLLKRSSSSSSSELFSVPTSALRQAATLDSPTTLRLLLKYHAVELPWAEGPTTSSSTTPPLSQPFSPRILRLLTRHSSRSSRSTSLLISHSVQILRRILRSTLSLASDLRRRGEWELSYVVLEGIVGGKREEEEERNMEAKIDKFIYV